MDAETIFIDINNSFIDINKSAANVLSGKTQGDRVIWRTRHVFSNRSVKQREDTLTNKLATNTHVIGCKTQIAQCAAVNNWGDTWNIIRWWAIMY